MRTTSQRPRQTGRLCAQEGLSEDLVFGKSGCIDRQKSGTGTGRNAHRSSGQEHRCGLQDDGVRRCYLIPNHILDSIIENPRMLKWPKST